MEQKLPRVMLAAPASGSGKTLVACGILTALKNQGLRVSAFKCGPDYIDPMFHQQVLGIPSRNLDTFFTDREMTRYLFGRTASQGEISILEGVMGYYDGAGGNTTLASSYELAEVTDTPVILIVNAKGMSLSVLPVIQGFLSYKKNSRIAGVILNQMSAPVFQRLKDKIEQELSVKALGYVPNCPELMLESRHLGLVTPGEVTDIQSKLQKLAAILEETLDFNGLIACAKTAPELDWKKREFCPAENWHRRGDGVAKNESRLRIGIAKDEAFCFSYQDNLELLQELGADLVYFSPLREQELPRGLDGMILCGGYPELYAEKLSGNRSMRASIWKKIDKGLPFLAECGGYLYLQEWLEDLEGRQWEMAGVFAGKASPAGRLGRFGYLTLTSDSSEQLLKPGEKIRAHEYHYYTCTENGRDYHGRKPAGGQEWDCIQGGSFYAAGFPHLYYYSNPGFVKRFLERCLEFRLQKERIPLV